MKEVWVLKLNLKWALAKDEETEDFPLTGEDRVAKGGGSLLRSPGSDLSLCRCYTSKDQVRIWCCVLK
ncbi:hypothetical protein BHM03_00049198 [Ensete ventricosum]|nr:hypothetical protein BHM03_00049198 [Ensete ventricosum]